MKVLLEFDTNYPNIVTCESRLELPLPNSGTTIVTKGFKSDGNSTPKQFWSLIPPFKFPIAYLFHDALCERALNTAMRKKADLDYKWILETYYNCWALNMVGYMGVSIGRFLRRFRGYSSIK